MSEVRQRKLKDDVPVRNVSHSRSSTHYQPRNLRRGFLVLVMFAVFVIYFMGFFSNQNVVLEGIAKSLGYQTNIVYHAVIIDAGSSGSRVLAYRFRIPFSVFGDNLLDLEEEYFEESKPGLSSFADDPDKGADTIIHLINQVKDFVPDDKKAKTPLIVRATAGLRLLPAKHANDLIESAKTAIKKLGYHIGPNAVTIMDGADEGIFIWYTVNLLHDHLNTVKTLAALDLGGGSTQITYELNEAETKTFPSEDQFVVPSGSINRTVYTHSYLNLGLLAARYGVLRLEAGDETVTNFTSVCVDPIIQNEPWVYANRKYFVSGARRPKEQKRNVTWSRCHELVKKYVLRTMDWIPERAPRGDVAAMSYYFDIAADAGMIDVMEGGSVAVEGYKEFGLWSCSASNIEQPWACLNLVYVATFLGDGLKIDQKKPISLYKKINGHEVSWALGLAYSTVLDNL